jgi:methylenetetrahydrofolate reductase (NADPH)
MQISFEVFPPKKDGNFETAFAVVKRLSELKPEFISVTYGAGGSKAGKTLEIASYIQRECDTQAVAHLTCVGSTRQEILERCREFEERGITHVLALRGDRPRDMSDEKYDAREFGYATDLIRFLKENSNLHLLAACYPEKHFEAKSLEQDLHYMKEKQELGVEGFISQMFFENRCFEEFLNKAQQMGIRKPVHAGLMPITSANQLGTSVSLSGSSVPKELSDLIARFGDSPEEMYKVGIDYAVRQILGLKEQGVEGVHIYTMNKPQVAEDIWRNIC